MDYDKDPYDEITALKAENERLRSQRDEAGAANSAAFQTLLGAIKTGTIVLTGVAQLAELAAERIRELEAQNAQHSEQIVASIANTNEAMKRWLEVGAQLAGTQERGKELENENARLQTQLALAGEANFNIQTYSEEIIEQLRAALTEAKGQIAELEQEPAEPEQEEAEPIPVNPYAHCEELLAEVERLRKVADAALHYFDVDNNNWQCLQGVFDITYDKNRLLHRQVAEAEETLRRGQFSIAQMEKEVEYQKHHTIVATEGWKQAQGQLAASEEALAQVQQENAALREERDKLQERSGILNRQIDIKRADLRRADQDYNTLQEEQNAANERIKEAEETVEQAQRAQESAESRERELSAALARSKERSKTGRLRAMRTINRLLDELEAADRSADYERSMKYAWQGLGMKLGETIQQQGRKIEAARKVADAALHYFDVDTDRADWDAQAFCALDDAVRAYREQTNNQQPQGEQPMPENMFVMDVPQDQEENSQTALEAEMKRRLDDLLGERQAAAEQKASAGRSDLEEFEAEVREAIDNPNPKRHEEPATTKPPTAQWPITPETAPAGARILIKSRSLRHSPVYEVTIHEWSPSGERVLVYNRAGRTYWSEDLPRDGVLVETLPECLERQIATAIAKEMMSRLMGDGAERGQASGLDAGSRAIVDEILKGKPGAAEQEGDAERS